MPNLCKACEKTGAALVCSKCKLVRYCSAECQRADWRYHKRLCSQTDRAITVTSKDTPGDSSHGPTEEHMFVGRTISPDDAAAYVYPPVLRCNQLAATPTVKLSELLRGVALDRRKCTQADLRAISKLLQQGADPLAGFITYQRLADVRAAEAALQARGPGLDGLWTALTGGASVPAYSGLCALAAVELGDHPALQLLLQAQAAKGKLQRYLHVDSATVAPEEGCIMELRGVVDAVIQMYEANQPHSAAMMDAVLQVYPVSGQAISVASLSPVHQPASFTALESVFDILMTVRRPDGTFEPHLKPDSIRQIVRALVGAGLDLNQHNFQGLSCIGALVHCVRMTFDLHARVVMPCPQHGQCDQPHPDRLDMEGVATALVATLEAGANPNIRDVAPSLARRPLDWLCPIAIGFEPADMDRILEALLKAGCDFRPLPFPFVDQHSGQGGTASSTDGPVDTLGCWIDELSQSGDLPKVKQPLLGQRVERIVRFAVEKAGLDVNTRLPCHGNTPMLFSFVSNAHFHACYFVLHAGTDPRLATTGEHGISPLAYLEEKLEGRCDLDPHIIACVYDLIWAMREAAARLDAKEEAEQAAAGGPS